MLEHVYRELTGGILLVQVVVLGIMQTRCTPQFIQEVDVTFEHRVVRDDSTSLYPAIPLVIVQYEVEEPALAGGCQSPDVAAFGLEEVRQGVDEVRHVGPMCAVPPHVGDTR